MSKFSAKKPITIFVAILIVIIFGVIGFTKMTPDLLPDMDFPYVVIVTSYPGATPEEVESTVSKPLEQSMATLDNLKTVHSSSSENYSMVSLEFETDTNMDAVMVDIMQTIQSLSDKWEDGVGTPSVMKINPNMIPVMTAAVNMDGMSRPELSQFANETLIPALEGTTGVASISTSGLLEQSITVTIRQDLVDAVNEKLAQAIRGSLSDVRNQLDSAQENLDQAKQELENQKDNLTATQNSTASSMGTASLKLDETLAAYQAYNAQLTSLKASQSALEAEKSAYLDGLSQMKDSLQQLDDAMAQLQETRASLAPLLSLTLDGATPLETLVTDPGLLGALQTQGCNTLADVRNLDGTLAGQLEQLQENHDALMQQQESAQQRVEQIDTELANLNTEIATLQAIVDQYSAAISAAQNGYVTMQQSVLNAAAAFGSGQAQLASGQSRLADSQTDLDSAKQEYENSVQTALEQANLAGTITMSTISQLLSAQDFDMPAGYVQQDGQSWIVSVGDGINSVDALKNLTLFDTGVEAMAPICLSDVAEVKKNDNADTIYASINGGDGLVLVFSKQSTYATASVSDNINAAFEKLSKQYDGLSFTSLMDQGQYIYTITDSIIQSLLLGALFAVLILFLFLRDWKPTFITLCSIPVSVLFAIALMYFSGVTLNMMSLSGLAISVGMLVDNSVVVIENTYRLRALGESPVKAAVSGAAQVAGAIAASTLTTICVFVPIIFTDGITKQLFTDLALTITFSLVASLIIALTLVPAMSCTLMAKLRQPKQNFMDCIMPAYRRSVSWAVTHKAIVLLVCLGLLIGSATLVLLRGFSFLPDTQANQLSVSVTMPEDTTFDQQCDLADQVMQRITPIDGVSTVGAIMSKGDASSSMFSFGSTADVSFYIQLAEDNKRPVSDIQAEITDSCADLACQVDASNSSLMASYSKMIGGSGISVDVYDNDLDELQQAASTIAERLGQIDGIKEVDSGIEDPSPELHFTVDKSAAMTHGLTVAQVYAEIAKALSTETSSIELSDDGTNYQVIITTDQADLTPESIKDYTLSVTAKDGSTSEVSLADIATLDETQTLSTISRTQQKRYLTVSATLEDGYNVTLVSKDATQALSQMELPSGTKYEFNGENESILSSLQDLLVMMLVGLLLVYLVMVAQFQSLKSPFIVMFTIPLAFTGGFLALLICGMDISMLSMLGMVMLVGIIVNNGIVLVDCINSLRIGGMERRRAIVEACCMRLRPILMTSITTILGLSVMAMGLDESSAMMQPLAVTCIGGLLYATLMTLFVIPAIYDKLSRKELRHVDEADLVISKQ